MSNSLFIGRWQPFHKGHKALIDKVLNEGKSAIIAVRDTLISEENPYTAEKRKRRIEKIYQDKKDKVKVIIIPDITEVCYGRKAGWKARRIRLDKQIEEISGTKTRNTQKKIIWLTGNSGSGKTTLAYLLKERLNAIVLDGDEMRASISLGAGFSKKDRLEHNLRVARLAKVLHTQGYNVVVSVIAPFQEIRDQVEEIITPYWIYVKGGSKAKDRPYEPPKNSDLTVNPKEESTMKILEKIVRKVGEVA